MLSLYDLISFIGLLKGISNFLFQFIISQNDVPDMISTDYYVTNSS